MRQPLRCRNLIPRNLSHRGTIDTGFITDCGMKFEYQLRELEQGENAFV